MAELNLTGVAGVLNHLESLTVALKDELAGAGKDVADSFHDLVGKLEARVAELREHVAAAAVPAQSLVPADAGVSQGQPGNPPVAGAAVEAPAPKDDSKPSASKPSK